MKPNIKLAETKAPWGAQIILYEHDREYCIRVNGEDLVHSAASASEELLGELAVQELPSPEPEVLIGGLGMGYTLKSVLAHCGPRAKVHVLEMIPEVVEWNLTFLAGVNGPALKDSRVLLRVGDVVDAIANAEPESYDAIILDIDNGPKALLRESNSRLYSRNGLTRLHAALKINGRAAIWSARLDVPFGEKLARAGFAVQAIPAKRYPTAKRQAATIYLATKPDAAELEENETSKPPKSKRRR